MNVSEARKFILDHQDTSFYQPIVFVPGVLEIEGKWHDATKKLAELILCDIRGKRLLDFGCSYGYFVHEAKRRGATSVVGIDHDPIVMKLSDKINDIFDDGAVLHSLDINDYKFTNSFDIVLMLNIIHLLESPKLFVERVISHCHSVIIEHEVGEEELFVEFKHVTVPSPRAAGYRNLTTISPEHNCRISTS